MTAAPSQVDATAASWVNRARNGDQIAQACLMGVAKGAEAEAKQGVPPSQRRYQRYYDAAMSAVKAKAPKKWWSLFSGQKPVLEEPTTARALVKKAAKSTLVSLTPAEEKRANSVRSDGTIVVADPELSKPALPKGSLDGILDPDKCTSVIANAWKYAHGLDAAALVLANGPTLDMEQIATMGISAFGSESATHTFFNGVRFSGDADYQAAAPALDVVLRQCLVVGQCVGRARKIQAMRNPRVRLGGTLGWELGE
jgi:hypothetical protein